MPHAPRHGGGFSSGQPVIGGGSSSTSNTQAVTGTTAPGQSGGFNFNAPSSGLGFNVGYNEGQVDPGLASAVVQQQTGVSPQLANQVVQQNMGSTGIGFGITGTGNFGQGTGGQGTGGQGTDTSGSGTGTDSSDTGDDGEGFDDIIFKVLTGPEINRLTPSQMRRVQSILDNYIKLGETNPAKLRALMTSNIGGAIFGKDQSFSDMEGNIIKEEDLIFQDGGMFFKDEDGKLQPVRRTKEGTINLLKEEIGSEGIRALKQFNPELYYPFMGMPATSGSLVELARIPVTEEMQGTNPELAKMIIDARMELDRMGKNPFTGNPQGGGQTGITSIPSSNFIDTITTPNMDITKPGYTGDPNNPFGLPGDYGAGFMQSQFYKPGQPGLAVMTPVTLPDGTTHMFPDSSSANQFQQYLDHLAMNKMGPSVGPYQAVKTPAGVPAALNYANIAPQFTSAYAQQGIVNPLMTNPALQQFRQNLGLFPGMA